LGPSGLTARHSSRALTSPPAALVRESSPGRLALPNNHLKNRLRFLDGRCDPLQLPPAPSLSASESPPAQRHQLAVMLALICGLPLVRERFRGAIEAYWQGLQGRDVGAFPQAVDKILHDADNKAFVRQHLTPDPARPSHQQPFCSRDCESVEDVLRLLLPPGMGVHVGQDKWPTADCIIFGPLRQLPSVRRHMLPAAVDDDAQRKALVVAAAEVRNKVFHLEPVTLEDRRGMISVLGRLFRACHPTAPDAGAILEAIDCLGEDEDDDEALGGTDGAALLAEVQGFAATLRDELSSMRGELNQRDRDLLAKLEDGAAYDRALGLGIGRVCEQLRGIEATGRETLLIARETRGE
jgi:hypothetical protein